MSASMTGPEVVRVMRANRITIRAAAQAFNVTLKRVREVRAHGVSGALYVWEWSDWLPRVAGRASWLDGVEGECYACLDEMVCDKCAAL